MRLFLEHKSRFSDFYPSLQEIVELHQYEKNFEEEMKDLQYVRNDYSILMQWLKKNEKLGIEDFWIEWYEEEEDTVKPFILNCNDLNIKFKAEEWQHTIKFLEEYNELY